MDYLVEEPLIVSRSVLVYRRMLALYPGRFRDIFGKEMGQVFQSQCLRIYHENGLLNLLSWVVFTAFDTLKTALIEHLTEGFPMKGKTPLRLTTGLALLGSILTLVLVFANWSHLPYPFPSKASLAARLWGYIPIEDFLDNDYEPYIPPGQSPVVVETTPFGAVLPNGNMYLTPEMQQTLSLIYTEEDWKIIRRLEPNQRLAHNWILSTYIVEEINVWQNFASPLAIALPLLWLGVLVAVFAWTTPGKLGTLGLNLSMLGTLTMALGLAATFLHLDIIYAWAYFTYGAFLLGGGLVLFGIEALRTKALTGWGALPLFMGVATIALEAVNHWGFYGTFQSWVQIQAVALAILAISWVLFGLVVFREQPAELIPA